MSALQAGLCTLPPEVMTLNIASLSGGLVGSRGPRIPLLAAGAAMCTGGLMLVGIDSETSLPWLLASYVVFGPGFGMVNVPITNTALSGIPRSQAEVAAAVASTSRQIGAALGVAVVGSVLSFGLAGSLRTDFVAASDPAWADLRGLRACCTRCWCADDRILGSRQRGANGPPVRRRRVSSHSWVDALRCCAARTILRWQATSQVAGNLIRGETFITHAPSAP